MNHPSRIAAATATLALVTTLAACAGTPASMQAPSRQPTPTQKPTPLTAQPTRTTAPEPKPTQDTACLDVPTDKTRAILDGTKQGPLEPLRSAAVQSETGDYFVAIRVKVDGTEQVGVWQTKALDTPSRIGSVNAMARALTVWPDTGNAGSKVQQRAEKCLR